MQSASDSTSDTGWRAAFGSRMVINRLLAFAICSFVMLTVSAGAGMWLGSFAEAQSRRMYLLQSLAQNLVGFCGCAVLTAWLVSRRPASFLGLTQPCRGRAFSGAFILFVISFPLVEATMIWNNAMTLPWPELDQAFRTMESQAARLTEIILGGTSVGSMLACVAIVGVITGFSEELLFRGTLQRILYAYEPLRKWSVVIAAVIFSAVHMQFFGFVPRLLLGLLMGYLFYSTGSLWPGVMVHVLNNSIVVIGQWDENVRGQGMKQMVDSVENLTPTDPIVFGMAALSLAAIIVFLKQFRHYFFGPEATEIDHSDCSD